MSSKFNIENFIALAQDSVAYDAVRKVEFHRQGKQLLRKIAKALALPKGSYTIRSNMGGIAVSGEVILHADHLYVQLSQFPLTQHPIDFIYRYCASQKDFIGGRNQFMWFTELSNMNFIVEKFKAAMSDNKQMNFLA